MTELVQMKTYSVIFDGGQEDGLTEAAACDNIVASIADDYANKRYGGIYTDEDGTEQVPIAITVAFSSRENPRALLRELRAAILNTPALDSSDEWKALAERCLDAAGPV